MQKKQLMKHLYLLILTLMSTSAFAQFGQIANGDFENWTNTPIYDSTIDWTCSNTEQYFGTPATIQSSDAQDGLSSLELRSFEAGPEPDTMFGYVFHGDSDFAFGIPYADSFDEVQVYYKSNMAIGDSAYIIMQRYLGGVPQGMIIAPIAHGNNGAWTLGSVSVPAGTQDSLWIGLVIGEPFAGDFSTPGSWVRFDNIQLLNATAATTNLPDHSFENWGSLTFDLADNWHTTTEAYIGSGNENVVQTTDANGGNFALQMTVGLDPDNSDTLLAFASIGPIDYGGMNPFLPSPYDANPTDFSGAYKYLPSGTDTAFIQMFFYSGGTQIGFHLEQLAPQATYTGFTTPLTIVGTPDSIVFVIFAGENPGSVLFVDDLNFSGNNVSIEEISTDDYTLYPNPSSDVLNIEISNDAINAFELVNIYGATVLYGDLTSSLSKIDVNTLAAGTYFVKLGNEFSSRVEKIIIQ